MFETHSEGRINVTLYTWDTDTGYWITTSNEEDAIQAALNGRVVFKTDLDWKKVSIVIHLE